MGKCKRDIIVLFHNVKTKTLKGSEIKSEKYKLPKRDILTYKLYTDLYFNKQYLAVKVKSKILFLIPFYYDQYVIEFRGIKYNNKSFTVEDALNEIEEAGNWIHRGVMNPYKKKIDNVVFCGERTKDEDIYPINKDNYQFLIYND